MNKKYTDNQKLYFISQYYNGESATDICIKEGISRSTFYTWVKSYNNKISNFECDISITEFYKLKEKAIKLEQIIEVLQTVECTANAPLKERLYALENLNDKFPINILCELLKVNRSTFYNHILRNKKQNTSYKERRKKLQDQILEIYEDSNQIYGAKKIKAVLESRGVATSDKMVAELMDEMNIKSIRTDSKKNYAKYNNEGKKDLIRMLFKAEKPNQIWVSDITYFKYENQFHYICVIIDLYARKVISYKTSKKHSTQLVTSTFREAYKIRKPNENLIFHSDRGKQYTSHSFQKILNSYNIKHSFSPFGSPQHNEVIESFFSSLKKKNYTGANTVLLRILTTLLNITLIFTTMNVHIQVLDLKLQTLMKSYILTFTQIIQIKQSCSKLIIFIFSLLTF